MKLLHLELLLIFRDSIESLPGIYTPHHEVVTPGVTKARKLSGNVSEVSHDASSIKVTIKKYFSNRNVLKRTQKNKVCSIKLSLHTLFDFLLNAYWKLVCQISMTFVCLSV